MEGQGPGHLPDSYENQSHLPEVRVSEKIQGIPRGACLLRDQLQEGQSEGQDTGMEIGLSWGGPSPAYRYLV